VIYNGGGAGLAAATTSAWWRVVGVASVFLAEVLGDGVHSLLTDLNGRPLHGIAVDHRRTHVADAPVEVAQVPEALRQPVELVVAKPQHVETRNGTDGVRQTFQVVESKEQ